MGKTVIQLVLLFALTAVPVLDSISAAPHYRMFTNQIGGGMRAYGKYFPHDEFYDCTTRDVVSAIANSARQGAVVACETPSLFEYYAQRSGRGDLVFVSLSDKSKVRELQEGDFVVLTSGRRYFSNTAYFEYLKSLKIVHDETSVEWVTTASETYKLTATTLAGVLAIANQ